MIDSPLAFVIILGVALAVPVVVIVGLFRVALRRLSGRRGPHDRLFEAMGRANAMNAHLTLGYPDPDDLAVPTPVGAPPTGRRRSRRKPQS